MNIGASATATCFSDAPATRMEWLLNGAVIASDTSTQQLNLEFSPVSDSIHNQVYVCRVTRQGGAQAEQDFTAIVDGNVEFLVLRMWKMYTILSQFHLMPSLPLLVVQAQPQLGWSIT